MNKIQRRNRIRNIKEALEDRKRKKVGLPPKARHVHTKEVDTHESNEV
jgi:hypothetical protein